MYVYPRYQPREDESLSIFIANNPFAVLVSGKAGEAPTATHLPVVFPSGSQDLGTDVESLVGVELWGHMGRANPHGKLLATGEHLMVFTTSHGYVSPNVYGYGPAVPTVDYAAVHVTVRTEPVDRACALAIVDRTVEHLESMRSPSWTPCEESRVLFEKIIDDVTAFKAFVTSVKAMYKLSQDMPEETRDKVSANLEVTGSADVAKMMRCEQI